ncbi:MAG: tetratricopeptide repeat protein [Flavobacteriales bacterium]|nr:tetratricopeptide repeat protein [Flavobacteriales bacterium]
MRTSIIALGILLLISAVIISLFYFIPKKIGYPKVGKWLSLIAGIVLVSFSILVAFQNELLPNDMSDHYCQKGVDKHMSGQYEDAIEYYKKVIKINPKYTGIYYNIGLSKARLEDYEGAIQEYSKELELNPENSIAFNNRGNAKVNLENFTGALQDYNRAIEIDPKYADGHYNRALCKNHLNDSSGMHNDLLKADDLGNTAAMSEIKNYSTQKIDDNTNIFYKANNNITNPKARELFNKGLTLVKKEDYLNAEILFLQANKIEPNNSEILNSLALSLYSLSKKQNAYKLFEKAIEIDKTFAYSYTNYAYCLNKERKFQKAVNYLERGIKYANNDKRKAIFNYTLAISYFGINECDLSKKNIDLAMNLEADKVLLQDYKKFKSHLQSNCN